ncbi:MULTISPECIES: DUF5615 family PIN-like protein [unclassified Microcoleus]|uniref:DUF5615 family PIN-like protein n=1 Tax=unclassified Microcoleus TaxID=2642155 RepID=UPI002FD1D8D9
MMQYGREIDPKIRATKRFFLVHIMMDGRILVTLDKDFGELAIVRGVPHCGIIRLVNLAARQQAEVCLQAIALHGQELQSGAIITAELGRLRIRNPG